MFRIACGAVALVAGLSSVAMAADYDNAVMYDPTVVRDWNGLYVGIHGGYQFGDIDAPYNNTSGDPLTDGNDPFTGEGWVGGGHIGYNFQQDGFFYGAEAFVENSSFAGSDDGAGGDENGVKAGILGGVTGRVGFAAPTALYYLTAGGAVMTATANAGSETVDTTFYGGTVGAGAELALTENLSARLDYRFYYMAQNVVTFPGEDYDIGFTPMFHTVTVGASWKF